MKKKLITFILMMAFTSIVLIGCDNEIIVKDKEENNKADVTETVEKEDDSFKPIKAGLQDKKVRVSPEELQCNFSVAAPDSIGTVYGHMTFTNNSDFIIQSFQGTVTYIDEYGIEDTTYYTYCDSVMPGETSPDMRSFASENMKFKKVEYAIVDTETMCKCYVEYEFNTGIMRWSEWRKMD